MANSAKEVLLRKFTSIKGQFQQLFPSKEVPLPSEVVSLPSKEVPLPSQVVSLPSKEVPLPYEKVSLPFKEVPLPSEVVSMPFKEVPLPSEVVSLPSKEVPLSSKVLTLPSKPMPLPSLGMDADDKLNFLLMGKTGEGKSATGNSLINRRYFKTSNFAVQETKRLSYAFAVYEQYSFVVVDGPDLISGTSDIESKIETVKNIINQAFAMCYGGIDALLFVIKCGSKFTAEDKSALEALKQILGDRYLDHVVVVVTKGDYFKSEQEEEDFDLGFDEWCRKQTGEFRQLYDDCGGRFVLFNNRETDEEQKRAQIQEVVQLTLRIRKQYGRYTKTQAAAILQEQIIPNLAHKNHMKDEVKLNLLLMGKTGHGKSATGNTILQRKYFAASSRPTSVTQEVDFTFSHFNHYTLLVVDGPGLADTGKQDSKNTLLPCLNVEQRAMNTATEITTAAKQMDKALVMCFGGVDAFLFVFRFGIRFTDEEKMTLEVLKNLFGESYLNHVIVVVTYGDLFPEEMKKEHLNISFDEWCRQQTGEFRQLYDDCKGRFVLFNNIEKNEKKKLAQITELVQRVQDLKDEHGRYTSQCFIDAERERQKLILELKAPQLTREIQEKISLLTADIEKLVGHPSDSEKENIRSLIQDLKNEIEVQDQGYGTLQHLRKQVDDLEENLDDVQELQRLAEAMEETRKDKNIWSKMEDIGIVIKHILSVPVVLVAHLVRGIGVAAIGSIKAAVNYVRNARS